MGIEERLLIGDVLIQEFERLARELCKSSGEDLPKIIKKAHMIKAKMHNCYIMWDKPPELLRQIEVMDGIIKNIEELHNKHV